MVNSWSISGNSCKKIIRAIRVIRLNPLFKKNLCPSVVSVGEEKKTRLPSLWKTGGTNAYN